MMEGLLHHNTTMPLKRNYVDTHGQSEIAFSFCYVLNFELMPRFIDDPTHQLAAAKGCAIIAAFLVNFSLSHFVVFKRRHTAP